MRKPIAHGHPFPLSALDDLSDAELAKRADDLFEAGLKIAARSVRGRLEKRQFYRDLNACENPQNKTHEVLS